MTGIPAVSAPSDRTRGARLDRALGALYGLAVGDALGMPTQMLSRREIRERFDPLDGFAPAAPDHPLAAGLPAGSVTDDTEQAVLLARLLVEGHGHVDPIVLAHRLVAWEDDMRARGSLDLLGPSTRAAVAAVQAGTPVEQAGRNGTTNGAAMRIAPVALTVGVGDLEVLVDRVVEASRVTHNTGIAISGAAAVAAAVSAGIDGASLDECCEIAVEAARLGERRGRWVAAGDVARRIDWVTHHVSPDDPEGSLTDIYELVGTSLATQESVPAAFGVLAVHPDDPWAACRAAASLGGDCDTIAAMAGAVAGACRGLGGFPAGAVETVRRVNGLDLGPLAEDLLELRAA